MSEQPDSLANTTQDFPVQTDALRQQFEAAWRSGARPTATNFLRALGLDPAALPQDFVCELSHLEEEHLQQAREQNSARFTLTVIQGPHLGATFTFQSHDLFIVGRGQKAHFRLPQTDDAISRIHFLIETNPPHCRLIDMGSANGTFLNGTRVQSAELGDGDEIQAGETTFRVRLLNSGELAATGTFISVREANVPSALPSTAEVISPAAGHALPAIKGYETIYRLGGGGMGIVYLARRITDKSMVALKVIRPAVAGSSTQIERFLREANILRQLDHPNIVPFRDLGETGGLLYFAMEHIEGADAAAILNQDGMLSVPRAVGWICQLLDALKYAHDRRFVHRDVKPSNLMVTKARHSEFIRLVDFGLARVYQASVISGVTVSGQAGGTPAFMAPEQITAFREAQPAVDIYATGATLYNLLTAHYPFDPSGTIPQRMMRILQDPPIPITRWRPDLPRDLIRLIDRSLAKNPADRFPDCQAMSDALRLCVR